MTSSDFDQARRKLSENVQPFFYCVQKIRAMEVVSEVPGVPGVPGAELFNRDALVHMFQEFRQEIVVLLKDTSRKSDAVKEDVHLVRNQLMGLRADHDTLQQQVTDLKTKVSEIRHPSALPTTPEEDSVVSKSRAPKLGSIPAKKNSIVRNVRQF